jgi:HD-GYP domain-containing protein (c-di-GMP phosphodiesterase class II)
VLIVSLEEAEAGMKLAAPVLHPAHPDQMLLKAGYVLETSVKARMRDLGVDFVVVEYPGLDELDKDLAVYLSPARQTLYQQIKKSIVASQRGTRPNVSYGDYYSATRDLIDTLLTQGQHPVYLDQMSRLGTDAVGHATAVAHLSLLLGIKLEMYLIGERKRLPPNRAKEVVNLGVAGMLHDLGKSGLAEEARNCTQVDLPADEGRKREYQEHSRLGYEIIHDDVEPTAASAVLHHHQHYDGSGFPVTAHADGTATKMSEKHIHVFARVIMMADLYDRISTRPDGSRRPNVEVYHLIREKFAGWLDPIILQTLQEVAPPYPPGTRLSLTDGTRAMVVRLTPGDPYHPVVRRLDADGWTMTGSEIDLGGNSAPQIQMVGKPAAAHRKAS